MSISYKLRRNKYGDYRDQLQELVDFNPGQISFEEYCYMFQMIANKSGSNFLVFGLGKDSHMWMKCNQGGKTVFLEHDPAWIELAKQQIPGVDVRLTNYTGNGHDAIKLLEDYKKGDNDLNLELDDDIRNTEWDFILVDAPTGYHPNKPNRMKSIYESFNLSNNSKSIDIFVHDCGREIEDTYTKYFFKDFDFIKEIDDNKHGVLRHYKKRGKNENKTSK